MSGEERIRRGRILREVNRIKVLEALMEGEARLGEIAARSGVHRRTVSRCLRELMDQGLVLKDLRKRTYRLASPNDLEKLQLKANPGLLLYYLSCKMRADLKLLGDIKKEDEKILIGRHFIRTWMKFLDLSLLIGYIFELLYWKNSGERMLKRVTVKRGLEEVSKVLDSFLKRYRRFALQLLLRHLDEIVDDLYDLGYKNLDELFSTVLDILGVGRDFLDIGSPLLKKYLDAL